MRPDLVDIDRRITDEIAAHGKAAPISTTQLAERLVLDRTLVYRRCRSLQERGLLAGRRQKSPKVLFFSPVSGQVLSKTSYDRVTELVGKLKAVIDEVDERHGLDNRRALTDRDKKLLRPEFRKLFARERHRKSQARKRQIDGFERQLFAIMNGTPASDLYGLRGYHPTEIGWTDAIGGPLPPPPPASFGDSMGGTPPDPPE